MARLPKRLGFYSTVFLMDLAVVGLIIGVASGWWIKKADVSILSSAFAYSAKPKAEIKSGVPVHLSIPALEVELPVKLGTYSADGSWALDDLHAFYATPSVQVNEEKGTTLIYGHNTAPVFKRLTRLEPGTKLFITTENGLRFTYEYSFVFEVQPEDTSVFNSANAPNVTLQTCSGPWDKFRSMYTFSFEGAQKI